MIYYDIHTHNPDPGTNVISIYNRNVGEFGCFCGLDLQHQLYSLGLHPWKIREDNLSSSIDFIENNSVFESVKAIGECGLDRLCDTPYELQLRAFVAQIHLGERLRKPMIIHSVKAFDELIELRKELRTKQTWILHGFRGKSLQMEQLLKHGFLFSFGLHFNEDTLRKVPKERFFLETDDSACSIQEVYAKAAGILQRSVQDLAEQMQSNYLSLFA